MTAIRLTLFLLCSLFLIMPAVSGASGKMLGGKISSHPDWFKESFLDIGEDVQEAADEGRHVMLFMHLNGCPYCYKMVEENLKHAPYTDFIRDNFDVIALNIRGDREVALNQDISLTEKQLAQHFKVIYTPTIIFLNPDNQTVARINGYRSVDDFKLVLDYVASRAYEQQTLAGWLNDRKAGSYTFREHPQLASTTDLGGLSDKPVAVLFEDASCNDCNALHDGYLAEDEVRDILKNFHFVRLDALSEESITTPAGEKTTPRVWAEKLALTYRPGIVLFDAGREIMRIESKLYRYHFSEVLRYVGERHYKQYPENFYDYLDVRSQQLLDSGQDIDIAR